MPDEVGTMLGSPVGDENRDDTSLTLDTIGGLELVKGKAVEVGTTFCPPSPGRDRDKELLTLAVEL